MRTYLPVPSPLMEGRCKPTPVQPSRSLSVPRAPLASEIALIGAKPVLARGPCPAPVSALDSTRALAKLVSARELRSPPPSAPDSPPCRREASPRSGLVPRSRLRLQLPIAARALAKLVSARELRSPPPLA